MMKVTTILLFSFLILIAIGCDKDDDKNEQEVEKVFVGDKYLFNQEELIAFGDSNYTKIQGTLEVLNANSLLPLKSIRSIGRNLTIHNGSFTTLEGLNNLISCQKLSISSNEFLTSLNGLEKLNNLLQLWVNYNPNLLNFQGLNNLVLIEADLEITNNISLTSLSGFTNLRKLGFTNIISNAELRDLKIFNRVDTINSGLFIYSNDKLSNFDDLRNGLYIEHGVDIRNNKVLSDFCRFKNAKLNGSFSVLNNAFNPSITDIKAGICKP